MEALGGMTVFGALDKLNDSLATRIAQAKAAGDALLMQAGSQLNLAIDNARSSFIESATTVIDQTNGVIRDRISQLQQAVDQLQRGLEAQASAVLAQSQQVANTLPLANKVPQVWKAETTVELSDRPSLWAKKVTFHGNWLNEGHLHLVGRDFPPLTSTTNQLVFDLPLTELFNTTPGETEPQQPRHIEGELLVPYAEGVKGLFGGSTDCAFHVQLVALSANSVGFITVVTTIAEKSVEEKPIQSHNIHIASTREAGNNDQIDIHNQLRADPGWTIKPGSAHLSNPTCQGDVRLPEIVGADANQVTAKASTIHHGFGGSSGSIDYIIHAVQVREVTAPPTEKTEQLTGLGWGERKVVRLQHGALSWKVVYRGPDGRLVEFNKNTRNNNKFIDVTEGGNDEVIIDVHDIYA